MTSAQTSLLVVVPAAALLASCSGSIAGSGSGGGQPVMGTATGPEAFTPAQVQAARAQCSSPHGPAQLPATIGDLHSMIAGAWLLCSAEGDPGFTDGIGSSRVYSSNGQWQNLGLDANGGLVLINGVDNQGTWEAGDAIDDDADSGATLSGPGNLEMQWDNGGSNGGAVAFETGPQRMEFQPDYDVEWYVPIAAQ